VKTNIVAITVFLGLACLPAKAETAGEVRASCKAILKARAMKRNGYLDFPGNFETGFCWGAFASLQQISGFFPEGEKQSLLGSCPPPDSTRLQYIKIFSQYVDGHPEIGQEDFVTIAIQALQLAFPCPDKGASLTDK
jgi:hypothetical protein